MEFISAKRLGDTAFSKNLKFVAENYGRSFGQQIDDFKVLSKGPGKLLYPDYYRYALYRHFNNDDVAGALEFVSKRQQLALLRSESNSKRWDMRVLSSKLLIEERLKEANIACANTKMAVGQSDSSKDLNDWLRKEENYPFFGKPENGERSRGVCHAVSVSGDDIQMSSGRMMTVGELSKAIFKETRGFFGRFKGAYLLQDVVNNRMEIKDVAGSVSSTLRVMCFAQSGKHKIRHVVWKVPVGNTVADNFWRGSVLAGVDVETGVVVSAVHGSGVKQKRIDSHPVSGIKIEGLAVPGWSELTGFMARCCEVFREMEVQAWDICLTEDGPVVVEMNPGGDIALVQHAYDKGVLTKTYLRELKLMSNSGGNRNGYYQRFGSNVGMGGQDG